MYRRIFTAFIFACLAVRSIYASVPVTLNGGIPDGFAAPNEQSSPSINLIVHSPYGSGLYYYDPIPGVTPGFPANRVLLDTFELPPGEILGGTISMRVRAGTDNVFNDSFILGFANDNTFVEKYNRSFGNLPNGVSGLTGETWDTGDEAIIVLDLGALPIAPQLGGGTVSVIPDMNARRFLDFIVQDETGIDFVKFELNVSLAATLGDFNDDGLVDASDYVLWRKQFGNLVARFSGADANGNGAVDNEDYQAWRNHFGDNLQNGAWSPTNVPEPASVLLLLAATLGLVFRRGRSGRQ